MGKDSAIEWTDHTFNPWVGCTKVSDGCKHCYAETLMDKRYGKVQWGPQGKRIRTSAANWKQPLKWDREAAAAGKRARVFCASLADVFEDKPDQPEMDDWRRDLLGWGGLVEKTPNLDWLILTKRPENIFGWMLKAQNLHFGVSVENQEQADKRVPELVELRHTWGFAGMLFLSMEPLLGPVDIWGWLAWPRLIDWVIVGGESGPGARPMHPDWARGVRDQCIEFGVPFFFKQWGEWAPAGQLGKMHRVGKKAAGRLLDGRGWQEFPVGQPGLL